jgi:hypothetical protein
MMFFVNAGYALRRMIEAFPLPRRTRGAGKSPTGKPVAGYGCCPACHEFVRSEPWGPSGNAICPSCGRLIRSLDALGSERPSAGTDKL